METEKIKINAEVDLKLEDAKKELKAFEARLNVINQQIDASTKHYSQIKNHKVNQVSGNLNDSTKEQLVNAVNNKKYNADNKQVMSWFFSEKDIQELVANQKKYLKEQKSFNEEITQILNERKQIYKQYPQLQPVNANHSSYQERYNAARQERGAAMKVAREASKGVKYEIAPKKEGEKGYRSYFGTNVISKKGQEVASYPAIFAEELAGLAYTTSKGGRAVAKADTGFSERMLEELWFKNDTAQSGRKAQEIIGEIFSGIASQINNIGSDTLNEDQIANLENLVNRFSQKSPALFTDKLSGLSFEGFYGPEKTTDKTIFNAETLAKLFRENGKTASGERARDVIKNLLPSLNPQNATTFKEYSRARNIESGLLEGKTPSALAVIELEKMIKEVTGYKKGDAGFTKQTKMLQEALTQAKQDLYKWRAEQLSEMGQGQEEEKVDNGNPYEATDAAYDKNKYDLMTEDMVESRTKGVLKEKKKVYGTDYKDLAKTIRKQVENANIPQGADFGGVNYEDGPNEQNLNSMIKNLVRFSLLGEKIGDNPDVAFFAGEEQKKIIPLLQELTQKLKSNELTTSVLDENQSPESAKALSGQLLDFLEQMQMTYISFLEEKGENLPKRLQEQIKMRITDISKLLGNADANGGKLSDASIDTLWKDIIGTANLTGRAGRSISSKIGSSQPNYATGVSSFNGLPVQLSGGIPFFPDRTADRTALGDSIYTTVEGRQKLLESMLQQVLDLREQLGRTGDEAVKSSINGDIQKLMEGINRVYSTLITTEEKSNGVAVSEAQKSSLAKLNANGLGILGGKTDFIENQPLNAYDGDDVSTAQLRETIFYLEDIVEQKKAQQAKSKDVSHDTFADLIAERDALLGFLGDMGDDDYFTREDFDFNGLRNTHPISNENADLLDIDSSLLKWKTNAETGEEYTTKVDIQNRIKEIDSLASDPASLGDDKTLPILEERLVKLKAKMEARAKEEDNLDTLSSKFDAFNKSANSADMGKLLTEETNAVKEDNKALTEHAKGVTEAAEAEKLKVLVAKEMVSSLEKEEQAIEETTDALKEHSKTFEEFAAREDVFTTKDRSGKQYAVESNIAHYDANNHQYFNTEGKPIDSITQIRSALMGGSNPQFAANQRELLNKARGLTEGTVTAEMVGAVNEVEFNKVLRATVSSEMGNLWHEIRDGMAKTQTNTWEEFQNTEAYKNNYQKSLGDRMNLIRRLGVSEEDYNFDRIGKNVNTLNEASKRAGISTTQFSEIPITIKIMDESGKTFEYGATHDQLMSGEMAYIMDSKTGGAMRGYESFQLTANALGLLGLHKKVGGMSDKDINNYVNSLDDDQLQYDRTGTRQEQSKNKSKAKQELKKSLKAFRDTDIGDDLERGLSGLVSQIDGDIVSIVKHKFLKIDEFLGLLQDKEDKKVYSKDEFTEKAGRQDAFGTVTLDSEGNTVVRSGKKDSSKSSSEFKKTANAYLSSYNQQLRVQERIKQLENNMQGSSGEKLQTQQTYLRSLQNELSYLQSTSMTRDEVIAKMREQGATEEDIVKFKEQQNKADNRHRSNLDKINATLKKQGTFFEKLMGGLKQQMVGFIDTSLAYSIIGRVRSSINEVIQTTKTLDAAMVDLQIASGGTREEIHELMLEYNQLGKELGRTTQSVAQASNDWLRAGYQGKQATELTRASMMLSTLGMIEASEATTYLISTLKGWKISAEEVTGVVDKLVSVDIQVSVPFIVR